MKLKLQSYLLLFLSGFLLLFIVLPSASVQAAYKKTKKAVSSVKYKKKGIVKKGKRSKGKRKITKCNPVEGKRQAYELLSSNETLARLADLEHKPHAISNSTLTRIKNDGEEFDQTDEELANEQGEDLKELEQEDNVSVDVDSFQELWTAYMDQMEGDDSRTAGGLEKQELMNVILDWVGTRYHYGGMARTGIDCSAFTQKLFYASSSVVLPRTASEQYTVGKAIVRTQDLKFGDLVFFNTRKRRFVSHVGVYLGDNLFAHSSSRYGVTVSSLESTYYNKRFIGGKRLRAEDVIALTPGSEHATIATKGAQ